VEKTVLIQLIETTFGKDLRTLIRQWSEEGYSIPAMAGMIQEAGIPCTSMTIRNWKRQLGGRAVIVFPAESAGVG
jgi:hypothetical protein